MSTTHKGRIWAVSMEPGSRQVPQSVPAKLKGTEAWRIHKMKEVSGPDDIVAPQSMAERAESALVERLRMEKEELQAKLDALSAAKEEPAARKPGRPKAADTQTQTA